MTAKVTVSQLSKGKQVRSRASRQRIIRAADELMRDRQTDEFALADVAKLAKLSIGAIYYQFENKDDLIRAAHEHVLAEMDTAHRAAIGQASLASRDLPTLLSEIIEAEATTLRQFAPILRPLMLRSAFDPATLTRGRAAYQAIAELIESTILQRRDEITHPEPERAVGAIYSIAYSALARFLGLGSPGPGHGDLMEWHALKKDVALTCVSFLTVQPDLARRM